MHAHFERQMTSQIVSAPAAITTKVEIDSPPAKKSVSASQQGTADAESKIVIESPLAVVDISNGDPDDEHVTSSRPSSPYEIKWLFFNESKMANEKLLKKKRKNLDVKTEFLKFFVGALGVDKLFAFWNLAWSK